MSLLSLAFNLVCAMTELKHFNEGVCKHFLQYHWEAPLCAKKRIATFL